MAPLDPASLEAFVAGPAVAAAVAGASAAWPGLDLDPVRFAVHLAARVGDEPDPAAALAGWHASDLYLACACAAGERQALLAFERRFLSEVGSFLARYRQDEAFADEVRQRLRQRLFIAAAGAAPRIAEYTGRGPLRAWLRVVAARAGVDLLRERKEPLVEDDAAATIVDQAAGPDLVALRARSLAEFQQALTAALESLSARERNLLRMHHLDGYSLEQVATAYRVSRATAARWLASVRADLLERTRQTLRDRLQLSPSELDSLTRLVTSDLDVSVARVLRSPQRRT